MSHRTVAALLLAFSATALFASPFRTFVASTGLDTNDCSRTAPCRSFGIAITKTAYGGEVIVLDSAGYGPVLLTNSVSLIAPPGVYAGITAASGVAIILGGNDYGVYRIRGLTLKSVGASTGIQLNTGAALYIENTAIEDFAQDGVFVCSPTHTIVRIENSVVRRSGNGVVLWGTPAGATVKALALNSVFEDGVAGVKVMVNAEATVQRCSAVGNTDAGFFAQGGDLTVDDCVASANNVGISSTSSGTARVSRTVITKNTYYGLVSSGSSLLSWGDNHLHGNAADGAFTGSISLH